MAEDAGYFRGIVTGLMLGAAAALLLTPKRGTELRHDLAEGAGKLKDKAGDLGGNVAGTVAGTVSESAHTLKERGEELVATVLHKSDDALDGAKDYAAEATAHAREVADNLGDEVQAKKDDVKDQTHDVVDSV